MNLPLRCSVRFAFALFRFYPAENPHARGASKTYFLENRSVFT